MRLMACKECEQRNRDDAEKTRRAELLAEAKACYEAEETKAHAEYDSQEPLFWADYEKAVKPALKVYRMGIAGPRRIYENRITPVWDKFEAAMAKAKADYELAIAGLSR
jgi:hypothetical protein